MPNECRNLNMSSKSTELEMRNVLMVISERLAFSQSPFPEELDQVQQPVKTVVAEPNQSGYEAATGRVNQKKMLSLLT